MMMPAPIAIRIFMSFHHMFSARLQPGSPRRRLRTPHAIRPASEALRRHAEVLCASAQPTAARARDGPVLSCSESRFSPRSRIRSMFSCITTLVLSISAWIDAIFELPEPWARESRLGRSATHAARRSRRAPGAIGAGIRVVRLRPGPWSAAAREAGPVKRATGVFVVAQVGASSA